MYFRSCRPDKREYSNKSIEKSKHRHHKHNDENKKKSNEDKLSDLNATEIINFFLKISKSFYKLIINDFI